MPFQKGNKFRFPKGNTQAHGKPKKGEKLAKNILTKTKAGRELVQFYYDVFTAKIEGNAGNSGPPSLKYRLEAAQWLTDRGFGRIPMVEEEAQGGIKIQIVQYSDPNKQPDLKVIDVGREDNNDTPQLPAKELSKVVIRSTGTGIQENGSGVASEGGEGSDLLEPDDKGDVEKSGGVLVSSPDLRTR